MGDGAGGFLENEGAVDVFLFFMYSVVCCNGIGIGALGDGGCSIGGC